MEQNDFSQINLNQNHITQEDSQKVTLLDTASTVDLACNGKLGDNTEKAPIKMKLNANAGNKVVLERIDTPAHDKVWFDEQAITNTFAFHNLAKKHCITCHNEIKCKCRK